MYSIQKSIALLFFFLLVTGCNQKPKSYNDCILKYLKKGMNKTATAAVINACREKFPKKNSSSSNNEYKSSLVNLTQQQLSKLDGRAGLSYGNTYGGKIYNGNDNITITKLEIQVTTTIGGKKSSKLYTTDTFIEPKKTESFYVDIITGDKGSDYSWNIAGAKGKSY